LIGTNDSYEINRSYSIHHETSFTAIDFETATRHHICSVDIATLENGEIIDKYHQASSDARAGGKLFLIA